MTYINIPKLHTVFSIVAAGLVAGPISTGWCQTAERQTDLHYDASARQRAVELTHELLINPDQPLQSAQDLRTKMRDRLGRILDLANDASIDDDALAPMLVRGIALANSIGEWRTTADLSARLVELYPDSIDQRMRWTNERVVALTTLASQDQSTEPLREAIEALWVAQLELDQQPMPTTDAEREILSRAAYESAFAASGLSATYMRGSLRAGSELAEMRAATMFGARMQMRDYLAEPEYAKLSKFGVTEQLLATNELYALAEAGQTKGLRSLVQAIDGPEGISDQALEKLLRRSRSLGDDAHYLVTRELSMSASASFVQHVALAESLSVERRPRCAQEASFAAKTVLSLDPASFTERTPAGRRALAIAQVNLQKAQRAAEESTDSVPR